MFVCMFQYNSGKKESKLTKLGRHTPKFWKTNIGYFVRNFRCKCKFVIVKTVQRTPKA